MTLEQCWHPVPGRHRRGCDRARPRAARRRGDVDLVGVAAQASSRLRPNRGGLPMPVRSLPLPRLSLYEAWHRLRRPWVERATGAVDVIHATGIAMPPTTRPVVLDGARPRVPRLPGDVLARRPPVLPPRARAHARGGDAWCCARLSRHSPVREAGFEDTRLAQRPLGAWYRRSTRSGRATRARFGTRGETTSSGPARSSPEEPPALLDAFQPSSQRSISRSSGRPGWNEDLDARPRFSPDKESRTRIHRLGWVGSDDLAALYAGASVFCFPSLLEGFGFPVVEAMAHGTPVVTSTGTSTEELVEEGAGLRWTRAIPMRSPQRFRESWLTASRSSALESGSWLARRPTRGHAPRSSCGRRTSTRCTVAERRSNGTSGSCAIWRNCSST